MNFAAAPAAEAVAVVAAAGVAAEAVVAAVEVAEPVKQRLLVVEPQ